MRIEVVEIQRAAPGEYPVLAVAVVQAGDVRLHHIRIASPAGSTRAPQIWLPRVRDREGDWHPAVTFGSADYADIVRAVRRAWAGVASLGG